MHKCKVEIQGQNQKFLLAIKEEVLEKSREKVCSFKDLETIMVFVHSTGALTTSPRGRAFCFTCARQSSQCFSANMK